MSDLIVLKNATKRFGKQTVVDNVSLTVPPGVVFALLGENGAGKSTLIRGLLGYHKFDEGEVTVVGMDPVKNPLELRRRVGYVADTPGMYEWMTVAQAGWYASGFYGEGYLESFARLLVEFELPTESKIRDLSKGMRAKTALALAIAFDPDLLILDEPTSGLDPHVRRSFLESMVDRAANGQTVFLSSHQIHEVERVADWIAILHEGKIQVVSPLEELKCQLTQLTFSMRDSLLAWPLALEDLEIIHQRQTGRTVEVMVRGFTAQTQELLHIDSNIFDIKTMRPNLEELYFAFTQSTPTENKRVSPIVARRSAS